MSLILVLFGNVQSAVTSILVGLLSVLIVYVYNFYTNVKRYPPGPHPLPILGNILRKYTIKYDGSLPYVLEMRGKWPHEWASEFQQKYGPVFTVWFSTKPLVVLATNDAIFEGYFDRKKDFAGRPDFAFGTEFRITPVSKDVITTTWSIEWEVLRRVIHSAARKFASMPALPEIETAIIDEVIDVIKKKEGINKGFDPVEYLYLMIYSILASTAAGKTYSIEDPEFLQLKKVSELQIQEGTFFVLVEFFPFLKYLRPKKWQNLVKTARYQVNWCKKQLEEHKSTYNKDKIRDVCDSILFAKEEAEDSDPQAAKALTDDNLCNSLNDFFQAGSDTTRITITWSLLIMSKYPEFKKKLKKEVDEVIGDAIPTAEHRLKCHYVQAFISEILRFKPIIPLGLPHKSIVNSTVQGMNIPKDTMVTSFMHGQLYDSNIWEKPETFNPERFLDPKTGQFVTRVNNAYLPFSIGRRACLGEKLALVNLFVILTRWIQKADFELEGEASLESDPKQLTGNFPMPFKLKLVA